jgi:diguanylate cyclase (GGDEF)-like protein
MESTKSTARLRDLISAVDAISILNTVYLSGLTAFWLFVFLMNNQDASMSVDSFSLYGAAFTIFLTYVLFVAWNTFGVSKCDKERLLSLLVVKLNFASSVLLLNAAELSTAISGLHIFSMHFIPGLLWYSWWRSARQGRSNARATSEVIVETTLIALLTIWSVGVFEMFHTIDSYWFILPNIVVIVSPFFVYYIKKMYLLKLKARVSKELYTDPLTGAKNRKCFYDVYDEHRTQFNKGELSTGRLVFIFVDVDHFKKYNDIYGHEAGDDCLIDTVVYLDAFAKELGLSAFRYGGEEFLIYGVVSDIEVKGIATSELIVTWMSGDADLGREHSGTDKGVVTLSGGAKSFPLESLYGNNAKCLIDVVDKLLYKAKEKRTILVSELVDSEVGIV